MLNPIKLIGPPDHLLGAGMTSRQFVADKNVWPITNMDT